MEQMQPPELCDVCGLDVPADEAVRDELTTAESAMCPTPMVFHRGCYEQASAMWQRDADSYCTTDPMFPETAQWAEAPPS